MHIFLHLTQLKRSDMKHVRFRDVREKSAGKKLSGREERATAIEGQYGKLMHMHMHTGLESPSSDINKTKEARMHSDALCGWHYKTKTKSKSIAFA